MVKNQLGGNKSKNISNRCAKKKIETYEPDFENSFFAIVTTKPNGMMCKVKICINEKIQKELDMKGLPIEIQANIGKLKNDKRNSTITSGDYVAVEFNHELKRANGNVYAYILCKYDNSDIKYYRKNNILPGEEKINDDIILSDEIEEEEINLDEL